ncbi:flagellar protein FlaG [Idiomarina abyssalis]|uniref:flagellar protein FlaG n=1 Tax=Idiomarina abyssalis TaxID=86102 RepID=UPI003A94D945
MSIDTTSLSNSAQLQQAQTSQISSASSSSVEGVATVNTGTDSVQQSSQAEQQGLTRDKLDDAVSKMNELMQSTNRSLQFSVDDSSERVVIKVMDLDTEEIVRQIPTEETLKFSEFLEGMVGLIFDQKV